MNHPFASERAVVTALLQDGAPRPGENDVLDLLLAHGLAALWLERFPAPLSKCDAAAHDRLKAQRLHDSALYAAQNRALPEAAAALDHAAIEYVVMKGAHVREVVYPDPANRPAEDIDLLVSRARAPDAVGVLRGLGYRLEVDSENISHEAALVRGPVVIDLHWDILRPGRTRVPMADAILARRVRTAGCAVPEDTDALFLMLVHPAFAKHVCAPNMMLSRAIDFALWVKQRPVDWVLLAQRLDDAGVKTAAWCVLTWISMVADLTQLGVPAGFVAGIAPSTGRARYLRAWLARNLPTRLAHIPNAVQMGFTLALHDTAHDAARALRAWVRSRNPARVSPLNEVCAP